MKKRYYFLIGIAIFILLSFLVSKIGINLIGFVRYQIQNFFMYQPLQILIGTLAFFSAISSILFSASRSAINNYEQLFYYIHGKRMLLNIVYTILIIAFSFIYRKFHFQENYPSNYQIDNDTTTLFQNFITFYTMIYFVLGVTLLIRTVYVFSSIGYHIFGDPTKHVFYKINTNELKKFITKKHRNF